MKAPSTMPSKVIFSKDIFGHSLSGEITTPFIMEEPHATAVRKFIEWAGEGSAFVEQTSPNNTIDWSEALKKLVL